LEDDIPIDETTNSQPLSDTYLDGNFKNDLLEEIKEEILEEKSPTDFLDESNEISLKVDNTQKTEIANPTSLKVDRKIQSEPAPQTPEVIIKNGDEVLSEVREKIATLFEGLKSDEIQKPEDKLNLTLKYLEYILEMLDAKIE
jgi:hypothetical protein